MAVGVSPYTENISQRVLVPYPFGTRLRNSTPPPAPCRRAASSSRSLEIELIGFRPQPVGNQDQSRRDQDQSRRDQDQSGRDQAYLNAFKNSGYKYSWSETDSLTRHPAGQPATSPASSPTSSRSIKSDLAHLPGIQPQQPVRSRPLPRLLTSSANSISQDGRQDVP